MRASEARELSEKNSETLKTVLQKIKKKTGEGKFSVAFERNKNSREITEKLMELGYEVTVCSSTKSLVYWGLNPKGLGFGN